MTVFLKVLHIQRATLLNHFNSKSSIQTFSNSIIPCATRSTRWCSFSKKKKKIFLMFHYCLHDFFPSCWHPYHNGCLSHYRMSIDSENLDSYSFLKWFWNVSSCRCPTISPGLRAKFFHASAMTSWQLPGLQWL